MTLYKFRNMDCEVCKSSIPMKFVVDGKKYNLAEVDMPSCAFVVLENQSSGWSQPENQTQLRVVRLDRTRTIIGSSESSNVALMGGSISADHAELRIIDGKLMLKDRNSQSGTFMDLRRNIKFNVLEGISLHF